MQDTVGGRQYFAKPLELPGIVLVPGDLVMVTDSRGRTIKGVFRGYASSFIALSDDCESKPSRFINIKRVNEIVILKYNACSGEG